MKVGIIGCGNISGIYLKNLTTLFTNLQVVALCDLDREKARSCAEKYNVAKVLTAEELLSDSEVDTVLNLTTPKGHYPICKMALEAGKNVYVEKPLSLSYQEGKELAELAKRKGLALGCAPDTFLGAGIQTCRELIRQGAIGKVIGGAAYMMCPGHESWHPSPEFYYDLGGGPLFDMGPYYLTALVHLLGRVKKVTAENRRAFEERTITSKEKHGQRIKVKVDTHNTAILCFECGAVITLVTSFDVIRHSMPNIELYGTEGSLRVPDPNTFGGSVLLATREDREFREQALITPYEKNSRGIGLSEMALAIEEKRPANASGQLALHVLEIMESIVKSGETGEAILLESSPSAPVPLDWQVELGIIKTQHRG